MNSLETTRINNEKTNHKKRKHITLTIQEKLEIIKLVEDGSSRMSIASKFGIGKSTVHDIHSRRDKIRMFADLHNTEELTKRRRVDPKTGSELVGITQDFKSEIIDTDEDIIDSIEEFEYQEIDDHESYETVYIPVVNDEVTDEKQRIKRPLRAKRKSQMLTFREKFDVIQQIENGTPVAKISELYGIGRTTVYDYMRRKQEIIEYLEKSEDGNRKTFKKSKYPMVDNAMWFWCELKGSFTKQQFFEKAKAAFAEARQGGAPNIPSGFCGSWSWAKRFFNRHPDLAKMLVTPEGNPIDPVELNLSKSEYLDDESKSEGLNSSTEGKLEQEKKVKPYKFLSLNEKKEVLNDIDARKPIVAIAEKFGVSKTTIYGIFKNRDKLRGAKATNSKYSFKTMKSSRYPQLELELLQWCLNQKSFPLSNVLISDKALCLFDEMELKGAFNPSSSWAKKFVLRHPELCEKQGLMMENEEEFEESIENQDVEFQDFEVKEDLMDDEEDEQMESLEFMESEILNLDCQEEHIIEELELQHEEKLEIELLNSKAHHQPKPSNAIEIPDEIALKSLKILINYSEQQGHNNMLSYLTEYERCLPKDVP